MRYQTIQLHPSAPAKPDWGAACNGCGVCCTAEPCPPGAWLSRRWKGRCSALRWDENTLRYRCGLVVAPGAVLPWLPRAAGPLVRRLALRWIAAARGCDSAVELAPADAADVAAGGPGEPAPGGGSHQPS